MHFLINVWEGGAIFIKVPIRYSTGTNFNKIREGMSQAKIREFEDSMFGDENVGSIHIPVNDLVVVDEEEAFAHLLHHLLDLPEEELDVDVGEEPGQVVLTEVKHQVERCRGPARRGIRRRFSLEAEHAMPWCIFIETQSSSVI